MQSIANKCLKVQTTFGQMRKDLSEYHSKQGIVVSYNPEKPQFWQPFSLAGEFHGRRRLTAAASNYFRYHPQSLNFREIVYGEYNEVSPIHDIIGNDSTAVTRYIFALRDVHADLAVDLCESVGTSQNYRHSFVWRDGREVMVDSWLSVLGADNYPMSTLRVFRGLVEVDPLEYGHAGGNTLIVLGAEELYRRKLAKLGRGVAEFMRRDRDFMPDFEPGFIKRARLQRR